MRVLHIRTGNLYGGVEMLLFTLARYRHLCPDMMPEFGLCFAGRLKRKLIGEGVPSHDLGELIRTVRRPQIKGVRVPILRGAGDSLFDLCPDVEPTSL